MLAISLPACAADLVLSLIVVVSVVPVFVENAQGVRAGGESGVVATGCVSAFARARGVAAVVATAVLERCASAIPTRRCVENVVAGVALGVDSPAVAVSVAGVHEPVVNAVAGGVAIAATGVARGFATRSCRG